MSKFGDWFLRRPDGSTDELSVLELTLTTIAGTPDEFGRLMNTQQWQEEHLLSKGTFRLQERGLKLGPRECYGFAPHPCLVGRIDFDSAMVLSVGVWQAICAQFAMSPGDGAGPKQ